MYLNAAQADLRCGLLVFFEAVSFVVFLPSIGISISFCPVEAFRNFFAGLAGSAAPTLRRSCSANSAPWTMSGAKWS
jgi:hypothetical protein